MQDIDLSPFIVKKTVHSAREQRVRFLEGEYTVPDADVLVWWKNSLHRVRTNQIGDGMSLVCVHEERGAFVLEDEFDASAFLQALAIYQEFDEVSGKGMTYLYKYPKDPKAIDQLNAILHRIEADTTVRAEGKFVCVDNVTKIGSLDPTTIHSALNFLLGLCVGYGVATTGTDNVLVNRTIRVPLIGSIITKEPFFEEMFRTLSKSGIYLSVRTVRQKIGSTLEIGVHDREIIKLLAKLYEISSIYETDQTTLHRLYAAVNKEIRKQYDPTKTVLKLLTK